MGRARRLGLRGILSIVAVVGSAQACGSVTAVDENDASTSVAADRGAGTAGRNTAPAKDPGGIAGTGGAAAPQVAMLPCSVCARADACCKAEGLGGCVYTAACTSASTSGEQQLWIAMCQAAVDPGPGKGGPRCAPRRAEDQ